MPYKFGAMGVYTQGDVAVGVRVNQWEAIISGLVYTRDNFLCEWEGCYVTMTQISNNQNTDYHWSAMLFHKIVCGVCRGSAGESKSVGSYYLCPCTETIFFVTREDVIYDPTKPKKLGMSFHKMAHLN